MDICFEGFLEVFGQPTATRMAGAPEIEKFRGRLPDQLLAYRDKYGFCSFQDGLFCIASLDDFAADVETWIGSTPTGGNTSITLDGTNIVLKMPGLLDIKGGAKSFVGPGGTPAAMPSLPIDLSKIKPDDMLLDYRHSDGLAVQGAPYEVTFADGSKRSGTLDSDGKALLSGVPKGSAKVHYGEDARRTPEGEDEPNPLAGWI